MKQPKQDRDMRQMLAQRDERIQTIREAQFDKHQIEDEIIIRLLRDNNHRFLSVSWQKLARHINK